jgi:hypothetical protein
MAVALVAALVGWPVALVVAEILSGAGGLRDAAFVCVAISATASIVYMIRRMVQDDRRTQDLLAGRLVSESQSAPPEPMA